MSPSPPRVVAACRRASGPDGPAPFQVQRPTLARPGFTFVEVLMVMLVMGIVVATVLPSLGNDSKTRLVAGAQLLAADLAYAQADSITHPDEPRAVVFNTSIDAYSIAPISDPASAITNPVGGNPYIITFGAGSAQSALGVGYLALDVGGDDMLGFLGFGQLDQGTDATITLACSEYAVTITVDAMNGQTTIGDLQ